MPKLYNLARMSSATTGTGTITLGSAVTGFLTFAGAGVQNADVVYYGIKDGANSEVGYGTYTSVGTTLTRNVVKSTNSNTAISLSGSEEVYITAVAGDGGELLPGTTNPLRGFDTPINLQLNASVATNILTISVKGNNGADPSNSNPVLIPFRDVTIANGDPAWVAVTSALSINTNATGATLGTANTVPFRLWVVAFNNAGTVVLALWQSVTGGASPTAIAPLNEANVASSTAISGTATSAGTFYTPNGTTVTSKAFRILGYVDYASGLTTAGTYASAPTTIELFGPGIKKPGDIVQHVYMTTNTATASTSSTFTSTNATLNISPTSAPNLIMAHVSGGFLNSNGGTTQAHLQIFRGSTGLNYGTMNGATATSPASVTVYDAPGTTSATTYVAKIKSTDNATSITFPFASTAPAGATMYAQEIMV